MTESFHSPLTASQTAKASREISFAFLECPPASLASLLSSYICPHFFKEFPNGRILLIESSYDFESRQGGIRAGYTSTQYNGLANLGGDEFRALADWQVLTPYNQLRMILDLGVVAYYPRIHYFTASAPGLTAVFIPGMKIEHLEPDHPTSWMDMYGGRWDFARDRTKRSPGIGTAGLTQPQMAHKRLVQNVDYTVDEIESWVRFLIEKANEMTFFATDPTEFRNGNIVDFIGCFEHGLSLDRLLRQALSSVCSPQVFTRKSATFECADIIDELSNYWDSSKQLTETFKALFNPGQGYQLISSVFLAMPNPFRDDLTGALKSVYDDLRSTIISSIFAKAKIQSNGDVLVRNKSLTNELPESQDAFTGNIVRALRNTHHGYMTDQDRSARPSRYLSLVSGNIPDTTSFLGAMFGLAVLIDPGRVIGRPYQGIGTFD